MSATLSFNDVFAIITEELNALLRDDEVIIDDLWSYEHIITLTGVEPTSSELYLTIPDSNGNAIEVCACCFSGEGCWSVVEPVLRQSMPDDFVNSLKGHIYYNIDGMTRECLEIIEALPGSTLRERINKYVKTALAHERRHAEQPAWLIKPCEDYFNQAHERDACEFSRAVLTGKATLNDVAIYATSQWNPNEEKDAM